MLAKLVTFPILDWELRFCTCLLLQCILPSDLLQQPMPRSVWCFVRDVDRHYEIEVSAARFIPVKRYLTFSVPTVLLKTFQNRFVLSVFRHVALVLLISVFPASVLLNKTIVRTAKPFLKSLSNSWTNQHRICTTGILRPIKLNTVGTALLSFFVFLREFLRSPLVEFRGSFLHLEDFPLQLFGHALGL